MGYVRTGGMSTAARRRRRTTALVLTGLVVLLLLVLTYAVAVYQGWGSGEDGAATDDEVTSTAPALQPAEVAVNVYNAKGEPGLAGQVAGELEERGFDVSSIDNDPQRASIEHSADIRHGPEGLEAASLMQESVPGSELVADEREGDEVDLVLGDGFEELAPPPADTSESTSDAAPTDG